MRLNLKRRVMIPLKDIPLKSRYGDTCCVERIEKGDKDRGMEDSWEVTAIISVKDSSGFEW